ncbi:MAG: acyl-CoA dehydrogenase family protein [Dehalococcoidia bacterium]|nr:acyl-CoA dehydrogenase family protein [Dehalococcoidia bacterium]MCB9486533.1 acyl-CoA dehydrogenase family protein [Thermoflexaceae bacterium]
MRFKFEPEVEGFRQEVREFIARELPPKADRPDSGVPGEGAAYKDYVQGFQRRLAEKKWLAMAWPKEYGGGGASHMHQLVYNEEMSYSGAPSGNMGIAWVGPSLMLYGTDEQKSHYIPRITGVDDWWCTLYSEPGSGSDLASLQTRALRDGDDYIINGQKIWTSGGHNADWGWLAARTDPEAPKHKGITMFLVDMKSPGVTVSPLVNMSDRHEFNEVFFEDVRVPSKNIVGELNRGWYHMAVALDFERSSIQLSGSGRRELEEIVEIANDNRAFVQQRPGIRGEIVDRQIELNVATFMAYQIAGMQAKGQVPNKEASVSKNFGMEMGQRISQTRMHLLGMVGQLRDGSKHQVVDAATAYTSSVSATIAGGTSEINRNIIATRGLGLPRG